LHVTQYAVAGKRIQFILKFEL